MRRELPQIARAVDAIVKSLRARRKAVLRGRRNQRAAGGAGRGGMSADIRNIAKAGAGVDCRRGEALRGAVEGAEDSASNGARELAKAGVKRGDVVVGIAASGTTPYVLGAIEWANRRGCVTVGVTSNREFALGARGKNCHSARNGAGGDLRLDAHEGRDIAENGTEPAFHHDDGAARQGL